MITTKSEKNDANMYKKLIRERILFQRENLTTANQISLGEKIIENYLNSEYHKGYVYKDKNISLFNSFKGEPDLSNLRDIFIHF